MSILQLRLYILVRTDKHFSQGKLMVHVGHICANLVYQHHDSWYIKRWIEQDNHPIIILSVNNLGKMKAIFDTWKSVIFGEDSPCIMIEDAGYYEVEKGTVLMCGLGPMTKATAKELGLKRLQLYRG